MGWDIHRHRRHAGREIIPENVGDLRSRTLVLSRVDLSHGGDTRKAIGIAVSADCRIWDNALHLDSRL